MVGFKFYSEKIKIGIFSIFGILINSQEGLDFWTDVIWSLDGSVGL